MEIISRLTRDGTAEPVSRDQILRHERGQGNIHFSCSADLVQDWQPYPVDPYSCYMMRDIHIIDVNSDLHFTVVYNFSFVFIVILKYFHRNNTLFEQVVV